LKIRYLIPGLAAIVALAVAIPAFGRDQSPAPAPAPASSGHAGHASNHAVKHAKAPARHHRDAGAASGEAVKPTVAPLSAADRAQLSATGSVDLQVTVSGPATVLEEGEVAIGDAEESTTGTGPNGETWQIRVPSDYAQVFAPSSVVASQAGTISLPIELTAQGKALLSQGETFELGVAVTTPGPNGVSTYVQVPIAG
jgi:hypothetical protein